MNGQTVGAFHWDVRYDIFSVEQSSDSGALATVLSMFRDFLR